MSAVTFVANVLCIRRHKKTLQVLIFCFKMPSRFISSLQLGCIRGCFVRYLTYNAQSTVKVSSGRNKIDRISDKFLYTCESWTLTAQLQRRIRAMEMRCYATCYASHTKTMLPTRKSVPRSSRRSDFMTIEKRRKLKWYGHVSSSSGRAKTILQGTVKGGRR